jgi:hypothetical protein
MRYVQIEQFLERVEVAFTSSTDHGARAQARSVEQLFDSHSSLGLG